jgi:hypothetical protein
VKWFPKALASDSHPFKSTSYFTKGQERWLMDHGRAGSGHCYLLVGTPTEHALIRYDALPGLRSQRWDRVRATTPLLDDTLDGVVERFLVVL